MPRPKGSKNKPKVAQNLVAPLKEKMSLSGTPKEVASSKPVVVGFYAKYPEVKVPERQTNSASCYDLHAHLKKNLVVKIFTTKNEEFDVVLKSDGVTLKPGERALIPTGLHLDIPEGYSVRIHPRSGISVKKGLSLVNSQGVIDSDYVDQVMITVINFSDVNADIGHGDRLAQMELYKETDSSLVPLEKAPAKKGNRAGGLGHTGF